MSIKGLVFDLDGVITETANLHFLAWKKEVAKFGIDFTKEQNKTLKGFPRMETIKGILKMNNREKDFSPDQMLEMANSKNADYKNRLEKQLSEGSILPGIKKLLKDAKNAGLKMSIASSSSNAPLILEKTNLIHYFDFIVKPGDIPYGKPAPDIFLKACEGIGLDPSEVIGFEDAFPGVIGLWRAKVKVVVAITHGESAKWDIANIVVKSTSELELKKLLAIK